MVIPFFASIEIVKAVCILDLFVGDIRGNLSFKDIEILNDKMGKPFFYKSKKIDQIVKKKFKIKKYDLLLSLSDEKDHSIAFSILIKK